jgi:hypothetical protein
MNIFLKRTLIISAVILTVFLTIQSNQKTLSNTFAEVKSISSSPIPEMSKQSPDTNEHTGPKYNQDEFGEPTSTIDIYNLPKNYTGEVNTLSNSK